MYRFLRSKKGFTLVELMMVVAMLGILTAIAIPIFSYASDSSKKKICITEQQYIRTSVRTYAMEKGYNSECTIKISSDGEKGQVSHISDTTVFTADILKDEVFDGELPYCKAEGEFTIQITPNNKKNLADVKVECSINSGMNAHHKG